MALALNDSGVAVGASNVHPFAFVNGVLRILSPGEGRAGAITASNATASVMNLPYSRELRVWNGPTERTIPLPDVFNLAVRGMNERGDIMITDSLYFAYLFDDVTQKYDSFVDMLSLLVRDGEVLRLGSLHPFYRSTLAAALSTDGQIVGRSAFGHKETDLPWDASQLVYHPFLWKNGEMTDLGVLGKTGAACSGTSVPTTCASGSALDINDQGWIVGYSEDNALRRRPVLWRDGAPQDLGVFAGANATARLINNRGRVAGDNDTLAFVWEGGAATVIGSLGGIGLRVTALNERGDVAGTAFATDGLQHAFVWRDGQMIDLGIPIAGGCAAQPVDMNARGEVLIAVVMRNCGPQANTPLTFMGHILAQRAVIWHPPTP